MPGAFFGKLIGGFIGLIFGGPLGFLIGVFLGHQFDKGFVYTGGINLGGLDPRRARETFVRATFQVMGHMAKADGQVSEQEIQTARTVMRQMRMTPEQVTEAISWFTEGKQPDFPLHECLRRFRQFSHFHAGLTRAFVELQVQAAMIGTGMHPGEREILWTVCQELGVSRAELAQIEELVRLHMSGGAVATFARDYGLPLSQRHHRAAVQEPHKPVAVDSLERLLVVAPEQIGRRPSQRRGLPTPAL